MKKKGTQQQQLQISSFIKQPASLKLLILAGTNIKVSELHTISKCTGLIKLDLSSNYLSQLPLKFHNFTQMKILYLHDNQLTSFDIKGTQLQYISLFKNPIQSSEYRRMLIDNNSELLGIDHNIITEKQKYRTQCATLPVFSEIKWPIVQISSNLEHQDDYLNLLKAQIFVINNVHKRTVKIEMIQRIFQGVTQNNRFKHFKMTNLADAQILPNVVKAAQKWMQFTRLKKKLRAILAKKGKQHLLLNNLQRKKKQRSEQVTEILQTFLGDIRIKMKFRKPLERQIKSYKSFIPANRILQQQFLGFTKQRDYNKNPARLYFRFSESDTLSKVCLYAKRLFFKQKDYDLCDEFNNLFKQTKKKYYIFRKNDYLSNEHSWLMNSIHQTYRYVLRQTDLDRKHLLYNKKGHKQIKVKNIHNKIKLTNNDKEKLVVCDKKLDYLYQKYDNLIQYQVHNWKILKTVLKIIRYINAGNADAIVSTETAYFQTEVILDHQRHQENKNKIRLHLGLQFFTKRVIAANVIQRFWTKKLHKKQNINIIEVIRKKRAQDLISKWVRDLIFQHRISSLKYKSYLSSVWKASQIYFHLQVYMNMPKPINLLRLSQNPQSNDIFFQALHKQTQVQIVQFHKRKWIKILYSNSKQAYDAQILFHKFTYCYYKGFFIKLFTQSEITDVKLLQNYERSLFHLFKISISPAFLHNQQTNTKTSIWVDNSQPYFIWSQVQSDEHFKKFSKNQKHNTNVNIFIYNKHKRPLKVSCEFYWTHQDSLYQNRKYKPQLRDKNSISIINSQNKNLKAKSFKESNLDGELSMVDLQYGLKSSLRKGKYMIDHPRKIGKQLKSYEEQKESRRSSLGSKNNSLIKSHRTRVISDIKLDRLSQTLNIKGK